MSSMSGRRLLVGVMYDSKVLHANVADLCEVLMHFMAESPLKFGLFLNIIQ
jgi:hypothetical protein